MGRVKPTPSTKKGGGKSGKGSKVSVSASISELKSTGAKGKQDNMKSTNTRKTYRLCVEAGKRWLVGLINRRRESAEAGESPDDSFDDKLFAKAFCDPPNKHSADALELYLTQKCFTEGKVKSADGISSAFIDMWNMMDAERYRGVYSYDEMTKKVSGNPGRSAIVQDLLKAIRNSAGGDNTTRNHAEAISIEDMRKWMNFSEIQVPKELASHPESLQTAAQMGVVAKHLMMRAFAASAFTLWTRNFELCQLRRRHIVDNLYSSESTGSIPFTQVNLKERKGWQKNAGQPVDLNGNTYEIYEQPDLPEIDMKTRLQDWITFYETALLKRKLLPDEFIFPYLSTNATVDPTRSMSYDIVQKHVNDFAESAGLTKYYTTHSFRRGGAQYRFMYAPLGKRWSLARIRWWGGWAAGEHVNTLIKYLLDELQNYEGGHGDALRPVQTDRAGLFMGDHAQLAPVTLEHLTAFSSQICRKVESVEVNIQKMGTLRVTGTNADMPQYPFTYPSPIPPPLTNYPSILPYSSQPITPVQPPAFSQTPSQNTEYTFSFSQYTAVAQVTANEPRAPSKKKRPQGVLPSVPGRRIPALPSGAQAWVVSLDQWNDGNPELDMMPLKDWPREWYTGDQLTIYGATYGKRRLVAEAFERCGSDKAEFLERYPAASKSYRLLIKALQDESGKPRRSKNGTPEERQSQTSNSRTGSDSEAS